MSLKGFISIKREMNLSDIESLYTSYRNEAIGRKIDIELPTEFKEETIGVLPSLLQFVSTVIRDEKLDALKSRIKDAGNKEQVQDAAKSYLWYVCACLHWLNDFNYSNGQSIKSDIRSVNQEVNELMKNYKPLGSSFMLTCFDHLPKSVGLLKMFYHPSDYMIVDEEMIEQYINQIIKNLGEKINKSAFGTLQKILKPLTAIVYELFKNTDDWATKDRFGNKIEPGVRGIYFRHHKNYPNSFAKYCENNDALRRYFAHSVFQPDSEGKISFLEISVFDSGDGFAGKRQGSKYSDEFSVADEVSIVKQCLTKYWTNEEGKKGVVKGIGLDRVLATIDKKGFFRIRTNKVHVFRDMVVDGYQVEANSENIKLFDWKTLEEENFSSNYAAKGSVITIIYPLGAEPPEQN